jgi:PTS system nitrogen regulatory IIA component
MQLQVRDVAALFEVPETTVYRWIREDGIPVHDVNAEYLFSRDELFEWATARRLRVPAGLVDAASPSLADALSAGGLHHDVPGGNLRTALAAVVEWLPLASQTDRRWLLDILLARESAGSTAVGDGILIPHARSPLVLATGGSALVVCHLASPLELSAPDGKPIRTLFTLVTPTVRSHLQLLARLAFALRTPDFREAVLRSADLETVLRAARLADAAAPST